jgi:hypothetical protein
MQSCGSHRTDRDSEESDRVFRVVLRQASEPGMGLCRTEREDAASLARLSEEDPTVSIFKRHAKTTIHRRQFASGRSWVS